MKKELLDYDDHYTDDEQSIYDHGYENGLTFGIVAVIICGLALIIIDYFS